MATKNQPAAKAVIRRTLLDLPTSPLAASPAAVAATGKFDPSGLMSALPAAYAAKQPAPLVPAVAYNQAFGTNDPDIYAHIATGAASQPTLDFTTTGVAARIHHCEKIILCRRGRRDIKSAIPGNGRCAAKSTIV